MEMDFKSAIEFTSRNPICYLGTIEGDQPRVRPLMMLFADPEGFYFTTRASKQVFKQIKENPKVEFCFFDPRTSEVLRISGEVDIVDDRKLKEKILRERDYLQEMIETADDPDFIIFRIPHGQGKFWDMETEKQGVPGQSFTF